MIKKGDTLVEVTIAIGIFSLIAISVASVMNSSSSGAQLSLETTLAREEIDTQAEAIRFIHNAYTTHKETSDNAQSLTSLWKTITDNAVTGDDIKKEIVQYTPSSCEELYDANNPVHKYAFILNPRQLDYHKDGSGSTQAYIRLEDNTSVFSSPSTYPRLIFGDSSNNSDNGPLNNEKADLTELYRAEGIYVIAVKDPQSTKVIDLIGNKGLDETNSKVSAYYDFYIRTCWYGAGTTQPSTISTVIRLHDSSLISDLHKVSASFNDENGNKISTDSGFGVNLSEHNPKEEKKGWEFLGWCEGEVIKIQKTDEAGNQIDERDCKGTVHPPDELLFNRDNPQSYQLNQLYSHIRYTINYDSNGSSWKRGSQICYEDVAEGECPVEAEAIKRSGYTFQGWCDGDVSIVNGKGVCSGNTYQKGGTIKAPEGFPSNRIINLKAIWSEFNDTITVTLKWNNRIDYDSHVEGQKSDGSTFHAYYGNKVQSDVAGTDRTIASLDKDCTGSCTTETFVINTLGGRNYYYYVRNFTNRNDTTVNANITNATVTISSPLIGTKTYNAANAIGNGPYWNVFVYKDGEILTPDSTSNGTRSFSPNITY